MTVNVRRIHWPSDSLKKFNRLYASDLINAPERIEDPSKYNLESSVLRAGSDTNKFQALNMSVA